jgi:DNA-binding Xre family transcriptional regulator
VTAGAIKHVLARQLDALMRKQGISKTELAKSMKTSRAQLDRLLDPENESVTLGTLTRAAYALGDGAGVRLDRGKARKDVQAYAFLYPLPSKLHGNRMFEYQMAFDPRNVFQTGKLHQLRNML